MPTSTKPFANTLKKFCKLLSPFSIQSLNKMPTPDRNYYSYDTPEQRSDSNRVFDPLMDAWGINPLTREFKINWNDTLKFHRRVGQTYEDIVVMRAGTEDGVDINQDCCDNVFRRFQVACGKQGLTFKGGNRNNLLDDWTFLTSGTVTQESEGRTYTTDLHEGKFVEAEFGNWSSHSMSRCTGNVCRGWKRDDGKPVRYAGRFGCIPKFEESNVKHVLWLSVALTLYYWGKYALVKAGAIPA